MIAAHQADAGATDHHAVRAAPKHEFGIGGLSPAIRRAPRYQNSSMLLPLIRCAEALVIGRLVRIAPARPPRKRDSGVEAAGRFLPGRPVNGGICSRRRRRGCRLGGDGTPCLRRPHRSPDPGQAPVCRGKSSWQMATNVILPHVWCPLGCARDGAAAEIGKAGHCSRNESGGGPESTI